LYQESRNPPLSLADDTFTRSASPTFPALASYSSSPEQPPTTQDKTQPLTPKTTTLTLAPNRNDLQVSSTHFLGNDEARQLIQTSVQDRRDGRFVSPVNIDSAFDGAANISHVYAAPQAAEVTVTGAQSPPPLLATGTRSVTSLVSYVVDDGPVDDRLVNFDEEMRADFVDRSASRLSPRQDTV